MLGMYSSAPLILKFCKLLFALTIIPLSKVSPWALKYTACAGNADYYLANISLSHTYPPDTDFSDTSTEVNISADSVEFDIQSLVTIIDDNIDEDEQSFAVVAEILDVPENISCFQKQAGITECFGNRGATKIRIVDNDGKHLYFLKLFSTQKL